MPASPSQKYRIVLACAVLAGAALGSAAAFARSSKDAVVESTPGVYTCEVDGFRFEYHAPTGTEGLYDLGRDPEALENVVGAHADLAARCRRTLVSELHVESLESLRAGYADTIRRLHALGYL